MRLKAAHGVDGAPAKVVVDEIAIVYIGKNRAACIEVNGPPVTDNFAEWQIEFVTESIVSKILIGVTGWSD